MPNYPFMQVDAFTDRALSGNPCAILFDTNDMDAATMQAIAQEMNLSETSCVRRSSVADFGARYFTPAKEIPLAGHPTIATTHALIETGRLPLTGDTTSFTLELPVGPIKVEVVARDGQVERITMSQMQPAFRREYEPAEVMPAFGLAVADLLPGTVIQTVSTGTPQLMIPIRDHAALQRAQLIIPAYETLLASGDFFSPHLFCLDGISSEAQTFARHFGVPPDTLEDPFTGSATGGMAAYLWQHGLIESPNFIAEQGHWMGRPGRALVEVVGPPHAIETVRVGGTAVTILRGEFVL